MMKQLPDKFQFRVDTHPGYTHTATRLAYGAYEINWARGWHKAIGEIKRLTCTSDDAHDWVKSGGWLVVDEAPKQEDVVLPDEFYFNVEGDDELFKAKRLNGKMFHITWNSAGGREGSHYTEQKISSYLKEGDWKILDKKPLTAEQKRDLKDFEEQIAQLEQSIKLNEQDVEHKLRLIGNYRARQDDLRDKIKELEGV
jgi:hypothetical protein